MDGHGTIQRACVFVTRAFYVCSTSNSMSAAFVVRRNLYTYTMFSSVPRVETMYAQTYSPSVSNTMTGITSAVKTFASA